MTAGALSSAISSAATTPFDVVKTRISTGIIPPGSPVFRYKYSISFESMLLLILLVSIKAIIYSFINFQSISDNAVLLFIIQCNHPNRENRGFDRPLRGCVAKNSLVCTIWWNRFHMFGAIKKNISC